MLRRFETYGFARDTSDDAKADLARALLETGDFIPEVLDSAVGANRSDTAVDLVWEHAYEAPEAYARYMCHPFHICVLDRYLLPENPECITTSRRELQLGLFGYEVDGAPFRTAGGVRRVLAMRPGPDAATGDVDAFVGSLAARVGMVDGLDASVAAENTMGLEWFPDGWTHVWEQGFADAAAMTAARDEEADLLAGSPMGTWVDLWYELERADPAPRDVLSTTLPSTVWERVRMIDTVVVDAGALDGYLDAFDELYLPGAQARGLRLVDRWWTPADVGEPVTVTTVLDVGSWADWERARNAAVADPAVAEWIAHRRMVMLAGSRTFANSSSTHG